MTTTQTVIVLIAFIWLFALTFIVLLARRDPMGESDMSQLDAWDRCADQPSPEALDRIKTAVMAEIDKEEQR